MSSAHDSAFNPTDRMLKQFAGMWIVFFLLIAARSYHHQRMTVAIVFAILAVTVGPMGLVWPRGIRPVFVGWMKLVYPIGWVVSRVILGVIFFGIVTPVALIFRVIGRDALGLKRQPGAATYWQSKPAPSNTSQYLRQF